MTYLTNRELAIFVANGGDVEFYDTYGKRWQKQKAVFPDLSTGGIDRETPYRAAVETFQITVRGVTFDVPEPVREPLKVGQEYYSPHPALARRYIQSTWADSEYDLHRLNSGLVHLTEAAAVTHGKALCGVA